MPPYLITLAISETSTHFMIKNRAVSTVTLELVRHSQFKAYMETCFQTNSVTWGAETRNLETIECGSEF